MSVLNNAIFTPLLITIKKLDLLIIANVLQWKCYCGLKACRYLSGNDVLFVLLEELLIKCLLLNPAAIAGAIDSAVDVVGCLSQSAWLH